MRIIAAELPAPDDDLPAVLAVTGPLLAVALAFALFTPAPPAADDGLGRTLVASGWRAVPSSAPRPGDRGLFFEAPRDRVGVTSLPGTTPAARLGARGPRRTPLLPSTTSLREAPPAGGPAVRGMSDDAPVDIELAPLAVPPLEVLERRPAPLPPAKPPEPFTCIYPGESFAPLRDAVRRAVLACAHARLWGVVDHDERGFHVTIRSGADPDAAACIERALDRSRPNMIDPVSAPFFYLPAP